MPYTSTPDAPIASLTELARTNFARASLGQISFEIKYFSVGRGGYNMPNPVLVEPIDPSQQSLIDQIFPSPLTLEPIEKLEYPSQTAVVVYCRLGQTDAVAGLGELGIWAEVVYSTTPSEIGDVFLLSVGHTPLMTKTVNQVFLYRQIIQF